MVIDLSDSRKTDRFKAAAVALLFEAALGYALIVGLGVRPPVAVTNELKMVGLLPDRPPPPKKVVPPPPKRTPEKEGAASPPNLRSKPTEIVRPPPPPLPLPVPPPVAAAPIAGPGAAPTAGAAPVPGPGTGSGGLGNGTGSGNGGNGGGGGGGQGSGPRWVKGRIKDKDYPRGSGEAGISGAVTVRYVVETDGHATHCLVIRSSGHEDLDETTCRLIEQRFRYKPARDRNGHPIASVMEGRHEWIIGEPPRDDDDRDNGD